MTKQEIKDYLFAMIEENRITQAIIVDGIRSESDKEPAYDFARKLMGSIDNLDVIFPTHEKEHLIGTKELRAVVDNVYMKPYGNDYKIYFIDAGLLNIEGQNILLKVLEEPPAYAIFIIFIANISAILPTVKSRCTVLSLSDEAKNVPINHEQLRIAEIAMKSQNALATEITGFVKEILEINKNENVSFHEIFDIIRKIYGDALSRKEGITNAPNFSDCEWIVDALCKDDKKKLLARLKILSETESRFNYQVNAEMALKEMLLNWSKV